MRTQTATLEATKSELAIRKASEDRLALEFSAINAEKGTSIISLCSLDSFLNFLSGKLQDQLENMRAMQSSAETLAYAERQKLESKLLVEQQESIKVRQLAENEKKHLYNTVSLSHTLSLSLFVIYHFS